MPIHITGRATAPPAGDARAELRRGRQYISTNAIAHIIGVAPVTVRSYRRKNMLPPAAVFIDGVPVGWTEQSIREWHASRPSVLAGGGA